MKRLLDLFSGAGGSARGYQLADFHVMGVDNRPQPRYCGNAFIMADALDYCREHGAEFDAIHASPPCQAYSRLRHLPWLRDREYPRLLEPTRLALQATGRPWVIENVEDAPMLNGVVLCGTMFGLPLYRHRRFESNVLLMALPHRKHEHVIKPGGNLNDRYSGSGGVVGIYGHSSGVNLATVQAAMGIDWMRRDELTQAIPPVYAEYIGLQLQAALR